MGKTLKPEDKTIARLRHLTRWPYVMESKSGWILDSTPSLPDSRYWTPDPLLVEFGFRIPIVRGIPDSLSCIPDPTAKIRWIPLYGARLEIPESFNLSVSCSTFGSINLKKRKQWRNEFYYLYPNVVILKMAYSVMLTTPFAFYNFFCFALYGGSNLWFREWKAAYVWPFNENYWELLLLFVTISFALHVW